MSYFSDDITGGLFPEWTPVEAVGRVLSSCGLTDDQVQTLETFYQGFRECSTPSSFLIEKMKTSKEWFRLLFSPTIGKQRDFDFVQYGDPSPGYIGQINLDNIGRDFLCYIYYIQKISELMESEDLEEVLREVLREQVGEPVEFTNLNNSLIPVEALWDYFSDNFIFGKPIGKNDKGAEDFSTNVNRSYELPGIVEEKDLSVILSDPPQRRLNISEIPSFVGMMQNTKNLSKMIRKISVCLQDGGEWKDIEKIYDYDYNLNQRLSLFKDRRISIGETALFARGVAMSREFGLWDINRGDRLPSIRTISEKRKIPYPELLRVLKTLPDNKGEGLHRFTGLEFLRTGFKNRLLFWFKEDIKKKNIE